MLPKATVAMIAALLRANRDLPPDQRLSNRQIAKMANCSRRPVNEMARGIKRLRRRAAYRPGRAPTVIDRCPECGREIRMPERGWPCLACRADAAWKARKARREKRAKKRGG